MQHTGARALTAALLLIGCRDASPGAPAPLSSATPLCAPGTFAPAEPERFPGLPPTTLACEEHCQAENAAVDRAEGLCGGMGRQFMDAYFHTPACGTAYREAMAIQRTRPEACQCRLETLSLVGKGRGTSECGRFCAEARSDFGHMYQSCAGRPGSANYNNPECRPATEKFFRLRSARELAFCDCEYLTNPRLSFTPAPSASAALP